MQIYFSLRLRISALKLCYHPAWKNFPCQADIQGIESHLHTLLIEEISARIEGDRSVFGRSWQVGLAFFLKNNQFLPCIKQERRLPALEATAG